MLPTGSNRISITFGLAPTNVVWKVGISLLTAAAAQIAY